MTLRKLTIDYSVKYVSTDSNSKSESSPKDFNPKTASFLKKQNKKLSQNNKKFIQGFITGEGFNINK